MKLIEIFEVGGFFEGPFDYVRLAFTTVSVTGRETERPDPNDGPQKWNTHIESPKEGSGVRLKSGTLAVRQVCVCVRKGERER